MATTFAQYRRDSEAFASSVKDRDDWLVFLSQDRDSDYLTESNFAAALATLGGESDTVEIVRFGHWGCGWVEHLFVHPSREAEIEAIESRLEDYPVLDEDDLGQRETEAAYESWASYGCREFAEAMQSEFDLMDSTVALLVKAPDWTLHAFESMPPYAITLEGDAYHVAEYRGQTLITREQMAATLRHLKREIAKADLYTGA